MDYSKQRIFVFGSNMAGIHGKGAALHAKQHYGAVQKIGIGHIGNSYAIPTKDQQLNPLSRDQINHFVGSFIEYARVSTSLEFNVTQIGCGLARFTPGTIAPMFHFAPPNCWFDPAWKLFLGQSRKYWEAPI